MLKNSIIIVLVILLAVMSYKYLTVHDNIKAVQEQDIAADIYDTGTFRFYRYSDISFYIEDEDKKFLLFFVYDTNGLQTFSLQDSLSKRMVHFNISEEGVLSSYGYEDKNYIVNTNIERMEPDKIIWLIQRGEWYNGYATIYEFLTDGSTNLTVRNSGWR